MKILFIHDSPFPPHRYSGQNQALIELGRLLARAGHEVSAAVRSPIARPGRIVRTTLDGVALFESGSLVRAVSGLALTLEPDALVLIDPVAGELVNQVHNLDLPVTHWRLVPPAVDDFERCPAGRHVICATPQIRRQMAILQESPASVIPPPVSRSVDRRPGNRVLLVNPLPHKGAAVLFRLARQRPGVAFAIQPLGPLDNAYRNSLFERAAACGNIEWRSPASGPDAVFEGVQLLLAPRLAPEGFARIVTEAHLRGIPVLATDQGGLPDAVGEGGMVLPVDSDEDAWLKALDRALGDRAWRRHAVDAALAHARRESLDPDRVMSDFLDVLTGVCRQYFNARLYRRR